MLLYLQVPTDYPMLCEDIFKVTVLSLSESNQKWKGTDRTNLPEHNVCVGAVPLLLRPTLQQNNGTMRDILAPFKTLTQSLAIKGKQPHGHTQAVWTHAEVWPAIKIMCNVHNTASFPGPSQPQGLIAYRMAVLPPKQEQEVERVQHK